MQFTPNRSLIAAPGLLKLNTGGTFEGFIDRGGDPKDLRVLADAIETNPKKASVLARKLELHVGKLPVGKGKCAAQETPSRNRPLVNEQRKINNMNVAAGDDIVAAILDHADFIKDASGLFFNTADGVSGAQESVRSQINDRKLVGIGLRARVTVQEIVGGNIQSINVDLSEEIEERLGALVLSIYNKEDGNPVLAPTAVALFKDGVALESQYQTIFEGKYSRVEIQRPEEVNNQVKTGLKPINALKISNPTVVSVTMTLTGTFVG